MFDVSTIVAAVIAALTAGGWLTSRRMRKKEDEKNELELVKARAESDTIRQRNELDYTKELLEMYSAHIVEPLKYEIKLTNRRLDLYEEAINQAPLCKLFPNCPVLIRVQKQKSLYDAEFCSKNTAEQMGERD